MLNWVDFGMCSLDTFDYGAFAFVLDIQNRYGIGTVPAIYRAYANAATSLQGIDAALPGGFDKAWRQFELDAFNASPTGSKLEKWYGMKSKPLPTNGTDCASPKQDKIGLEKGEHARRIAWNLYKRKSLTTDYDDNTFKPGSSRSGS
ncbi:MAG: hypothetical protein BGO23_03725 [Solirubrobacterales bacterium 67-14]|nr:MAG: hypothetical protein BGO23_03725 [Solirubrobacterales bacterium 67-14]